MDRLNDFSPIKTTLLSTSAWLSLSKSTRSALVLLFNLPKSGTPSASIGSAGSKVESDGFTPQDLAGITVAKMQVILDSASTDFYGLLEQIISVIENPAQTAVEPEKDEVDIVKKRRGRPKKEE